MKIMQNYLFGGMKIEIQYLRAIILFYKVKIKSNLMDKKFLISQTQLYSLF